MAGQANNCSFLKITVPVIVLSVKFCVQGGIFWLTV